jgi:EpsI family protein
MRLRQTLVASSVMLASALLVGFASRSESVPPSLPLSRFPLCIDTWEGRAEQFDENVYRILGVDDSILATYRSPDGRWINLYVGFYESQREGDLIHSPKNCLPGGGWNITRTGKESLTIPPGGKNVQAIKLLIEKGSQAQVVLYWFQSRGRFIASEYLQRAYLVIDSITRNRTDGSFVRLMAPVGPEGEEAALETLKSFAERIVPILQTHLPS